MDLSPEMRSTLAEIGYDKPTPVQAGLIPLVLEGHDVIGQSRTGTGKTASFSIPIIEQIETQDGPVKPQALILTPTRELAVQVENEFRRLAGKRNIRCCCISVSYTHLTLPTICSV